jgi:hypothetical protein
MSIVKVPISNSTTFDSETDIGTDNELLLGDLERNDIIRVEAGGDSNLDVTIDIRNLVCGFYVRGSPNVHVKIIHDGEEISSRFAFGKNVVSVEFVDEDEDTLNPVSFAALTSDDFDWAKIEGVKDANGDIIDGLFPPNEKILHDSRTHLFVAGSIPDVLESCVESALSPLTGRGLVFAAGVLLNDLSIDLNYVRLADLNDQDQFLSRCHVTQGPVSFVKRDSGTSRVPLEVIGYTTITVDGPTSFLEIVFASPDGSPELSLVAQSSFTVKNTPDSSISGLIVDVSQGVVVTLSGMRLISDLQDNEPVAVVSGEGTVLYRDGLISHADSQKRMLFRVEDTTAVEFASTGEIEVDDYLWATQLHLQISKGAVVSFDGVALASPEGEGAVPTGLLASTGNFGLVLQSRDNPDLSDDEIVVTFKNKPTYLIAHSKFSNGVLVDSLGGKVPIRLSTTGGGLKTQRMFAIGADTVLSNVGVLFRDSEHYDAMDIDLTDLSNSNGATNAGAYGTLVFGTQATCVDGLGNLNFSKILKQRKSGSLPIWISRARHVITSWITHDPAIFKRAWDSSGSTLRVLTDLQDQYVPMRLDAAFAVGLSDGTSFTGQNGNLDLRLEVLLTEFQASGLDPTARARILTSVQSALFGDGDEGILPHTGVCGYFNSSKLGAETLRIWDADPSTEFTVFFETDDGIEFENPDKSKSRKFVYTGTNIYAVTFDDPNGHILGADEAHMIPRLTYMIIDDPTSANVEVYEEQKDADDNLVWLPTALSGEIDHQERKLRVALSNYLILWPSNVFLGRAPNNTVPNWANNELLDNLLVRSTSPYAPLTQNSIISLSPQNVHSGVNVFFMSDVFRIRHSSNVTSTGWENGKSATLSIQISGIPKIEGEDLLIDRDPDTQVLTAHQGFPRIYLQRTANVSLVLATPNVMLVRGGVFSTPKAIPDSFIGSGGDYANYTDADLLAPTEAVEFRPEDYTYVNNADSIKIDAQETKMQKNKLTTRESFELALSMFIKARTSGSVQQRLNDNLLAPEDNLWLSTTLTANSNAQLFLVVPDNLNTHQVVDGTNNDSVNSFIENQNPAPEDAKTLWDVTAVGTGITVSKMQVKWHAQNTKYSDGEYSMLIVSNDLLGDATDDKIASAVRFNIRPRTVDGLCQMKLQTIGNVMRAQFHVVPLLRTSIDGLQTIPATFALYSRIPLLMHVRAHDFITTRTISLNYGNPIPDAFANIRYTFDKADSTGLLEVQFVALPAVEEVGADETAQPSFEFEFVTLSMLTTDPQPEFSIRPKIAAAEGQDPEYNTNPDRIFVDGNEIFAAQPFLFNRTTPLQRRVTIGGLDATEEDVNGRRTYRIRTIWNHEGEPNPDRNFFMRIVSVNRLGFDEDGDFEVQKIIIPDRLADRTNYTFGRSALFSSALINWTNDSDKPGEIDIADQEAQFIVYPYQSQISSFSRGNGPVTSLDSEFMRQSELQRQLVGTTVARFEAGATMDPRITNPSSGGILQRSLVSTSERVWVGFCPLSTLTDTQGGVANLEWYLEVVVEGKNKDDDAITRQAKIYTSYSGNDEVTSANPVALDLDNQRRWIGAWVSFSEIAEEFSSLEKATIHARMRTKANEALSIFPEDPIKFLIGEVDLSKAGNLSLTSNLDGIEFSHIRIGNWMIASDSAGDLRLRHRVFADEQEAATGTDSTIRAVVSAPSVVALKSSMALATPTAVPVVATEFRLTGHPNTTA